jgi:hypothetical protein
MLNLHSSENCGTIVGYRDVAVGRDENFVQPTRAEGSAEDMGNGASSKDVGLIAVPFSDFRAYGDDNQPTFIASIPWALVFVPWSRMMMNGRPY